MNNSKCNSCNDNLTDFIRKSRKFPKPINIITHREWGYTCYNPGTGESLHTGTVEGDSVGEAQTNLNNRIKDTALDCHLNVG